MPGDEESGRSGPGETPPDAEFHIDEFHIDITLPDGSKLEETHGAEGVPVESHLEGLDHELKDSWDSDNVDDDVDSDVDSDSEESPLPPSKYGPLPGNSVKKEEDDGEIEVLHNIKSDLSKNPIKVPLAFAGAAALAIGLIFGVSNWGRDDDEKVETDISRPITDDAEAEDAEEPSAPAEAEPQPTSGDTPAEAEPLATSGDAPAEAEPLATSGDAPAEAEPPGSGEWEIVDEIDDWLQFAGFDQIVPERTVGETNAGDALEAANATGMGVSSSRDGTSMTLKFAGDAQDVQVNRGELNGGFVIVLSNGDRWEVIFQDDGSVKIVSAKPGMSVTYEWLTPQEMLLRLTGITVDSGSTVEATIFLEMFTGINMDVVTLEATG